MPRRGTDSGDSAESQLQELYKMGAELQQQQEVLLHQLNKIGQAKHRSLLASKAAEAALEYMREAKPEARVYKQIARLFVLEQRDVLTEDLKEKTKSCKTEEQNLGAVQEQILAKISSVEEQSKDIVQQIRKATEAAAESRARH